MNVTPLRDRIVVEPDQIRDDITLAGIIIKAREGIHTSQEQLGKKGTVIAVGEDVDKDQLKPGDRVLYGEFLYPEIFDGPKRYYVMSDQDICGVLE